MRMGVEDREAVAQEVVWERETARLIEYPSEDLASAFGQHWQEGGGADFCQAGWLSLKPLNAQRESRAVGDLCAVGYFVEEYVMPSGRVRRRLLRQQLDSAEVRDVLGSGRIDDLWKRGQNAEPLVHDVLVFELWPLLSDGPGSWEPWHPELKPMPDAVELRVVIASSELQQGLLSSGDWDHAAWDPEQVHQSKTHEYVRLVHLGTYGR